MVTKTTDSKGRVALGPSFANRTVIVDDSDPDRVVIRKAVVIPESEAWLYKNEEALARVRRGLAEARAGRFSEAPPNLRKDAALIEDDT
jgi:hypothetical protein